MTSIAHTPAWRLAARMANKEISPLEVMRETFDRIDRVNPGLNAFVSLRPEAALAEAQAMTEKIAAGKPVGPLAGLPLGVKDLEDTAGMVTSYGSIPFKDNVVAGDSIQVARLKAAGAIVVGKTNVPEFGFTGFTKNRLHGITRNPWNPDRTPGGSSGGAAAAIAGGLVPLCTGSDAGGSIRIPASYSGCFGLKALLRPNSGGTVSLSELQQHDRDGAADPDRPGCRPLYGLCVRLSSGGPPFPAQTNSVLSGRHRRSSGPAENRLQPGPGVRQGSTGGDDLRGAGRACLRGDGTSGPALDRQPAGYGRCLDAAGLHGYLCTTVRGAGKKRERDRKDPGRSGGSDPGAYRCGDYPDPAIAGPIEPETGCAFRRIRPSSHPHHAHRGVRRRGTAAR
jgi:hypothetical protein